MRNELTAGNPEEVRSLAHSLKGVAGMLGALDVQRLAAELEAAVREQRRQQDIETRIAQLDAEMAPLVQALKQLPEHSLPAADNTSVSPQTVAEVLSRMQSLLKANDMEATEFVVSSAPILRTALGEEVVTELAQHVAAIDFRGALALMKRALRR